jgi:hypothetical protein
MSNEQEKLLSDIKDAAIEAGRSIGERARIDRLVLLFKAAGVTGDVIDAIKGFKSYFALTEGARYKITEEMLAMR